MSTIASNELVRPGVPYRRLLELAIGLLAVAAAAAAVSNEGLLLLALCLPLLILALLRFDFYICAVVFLLPVYPFIDWKLPVRDAFLLAHFVLFVGICVVQVRNGVPWRGWLWQGWMRKGMIAFTAVAAGSLVLSESRDIEGAAKALAKLLSYTAVFLSVAAWAVTRERIVRIIKLLLISTIAVCVFGLYQAIVGDFTSFYFQLYPDMEPVFMAGGGWVGRITSFLFHYNSLAGYLNAIMPLALAVTVLGRKTGLRRLAFICLCLSWAAVFFTGSRGGLVALGAVLLSAMFYLRPRGRTTAVVLAAAFLASSVMLSISMERPGIGLNDSHQGADDLSFDTRLALWGAAGALFLEHPVAGAGFGTYRFAMQQYLPGVRDQLDAHNLYLQTLAETGIIGFLVFFLTISVFFRGSFRLIKHADPLLRTIGFAVCAAIGATLVHGLVDYLFITSPQFGNLFWLLLGLGVAAREGEQRFATPALEEGVF